MSERIRAPKGTRHLRELTAILQGDSPPPPIATLLGFTFLQIELGRSLFEMQAGPRYANPMGTLHGGILCDLADIAMGTAMATTLEDDETFTTVDLTTKFFKPIWSARLRAAGQVVKRTRSLGLIECEIHDDKESLVAKVYSTCMALRGDEAKGR